MLSKFLDRLSLRLLQRRVTMIHLESDGLKVQVEINGEPIQSRVEWTPNGHWHQRQIGPEDEQGMALFEADWISGGRVCDDCVDA